MSIIIRASICSPLTGILEGKGRRWIAFKSCSVYSTRFLFAYVLLITSLLTAVGPLPVSPAQGTAPCCFSLYTGHGGTLMLPKTALVCKKLDAEFGHLASEPPFQPTSRSEIGLRIDLNSTGKKKGFREAKVANSCSLDRQTSFSSYQMLEPWWLLLLCPTFPQGSVPIHPWLALAGLCVAQGLVWLCIAKSRDSKVKTVYV